jgi:hypothetical protein
VETLFYRVGIFASIKATLEYLVWLMRLPMIGQVGACWISFPAGFTNKILGFEL